MLLFGVHEAPEFIGLYEARMNISDALIGEVTGFCADGKKQRKDSALVGASDPRDGAYAHSFHQERDDLSGFISRNVVSSKRSLARRSERSLAIGAAVTLDFIATVESESSSFGVLATLAGHGLSPLVFLREKPDNQSLGSECGLLPRLDSAPSLASLATGRLLSHLIFPPMYPGSGGGG